MPYVTDIEIIYQNIRRKAPKIHCLTHPVTMQEDANLLLAAGGSAVLCTADSPFDAACAAGTLWREVAYCAGQRTDAVHGGIGTFHTQLFDVLEEKIFDTETNL